jgi:uncharacterized protein (TIRG00374 family)
METQPQPSVSKPTFKLSRGKFIFYFITLAAIVVVYLRLDELTQIKDIFVSSDGFWLFAMVLSQLVFYYFLALNYQYVLRIKDLYIGARELFPVTFIVQFFNQVLPSANVSGQAFFIYYLRKYKLTVGDGIGRMILEQMTMYIAFGILLVASIFIMGLQGIFILHPEALIFVYVFLFFAVTLVPIFFIVQRRQNDGGKNKYVMWFVEKVQKYMQKLGLLKYEKARTIAENAEQVNLFFEQFKSSLDLKLLQKRAKTFWFSILWHIVSLFGNVFTVWFAAKAIGVDIGFEVALVTYTLTKLVAMLAFVPGAIGVFELVATLILVGFGLDAGSALAIALLTRAFTFWLPMPVGWAMYKSYTRRISSEIKAQAV